MKKKTETFVRIPSLKHSLRAMRDTSKCQKSSHDWGRWSWDVDHDLRGRDKGRMCRRCGRTEAFFIREGTSKEELTAICAGAFVYDEASAFEVVDT